MKIYRPLWNEGALLSPQQFQQQAEWESFRSAGASALATPFPWGVEKIEFNDSFLSSGLIQITQLRLWLEDGSLIDAQRSDLLPPPRELDPNLLAGLDAVTVVIALPHLQPGVVNVEQEGMAADRPLRYREEWVTIPDVFGSEEESMAVARFNFTIRFAHESNEAWKVCPVARLLRDGQNAWRQDPSFIPPVASFGASPVLRERLVLLNRQLRSRRQRLMTMRRESNERLADFAVADVSLFWLLNALNSHARVLTEYERFPCRPPEQVWAELARLAGSMLTFSLDHDLDAIPGYDHEEPANAFPPLFDLIAGLLEASLPSRVIALEMSRPDGQTWKANLHNIRLREEADLWLSVRSDIDNQIQMFEQRLKPLNEAVLFSAPEGVTLTSGEHLQMTAAKNVAVNAGGDISVGAMGNMTALAGDKLGVFTRSGQLSLKSGEGPVEVQAQNASMSLFAEKKLTLGSASDISITGKKRITLIGCGSYLRLDAGKVEYGTTATYQRKVKKTMAAGSATLEQHPVALPAAVSDEKISSDMLLRKPGETDTQWAERLVKLNVAARLIEQKTGIPRSRIAKWPIYRKIIEEQNQAKAEKTQGRQQAAQLMCDKDIVTHKDLVVISRKTGIPTGTLRRMDEYRARRPEKQKETRIQDKEKAKKLLLEKRSVRAIAKETQVAERTLHNWKHDLKNLKTNDVAASVSERENVLMKQIATIKQVVGKECNAVQSVQIKMKALLSSAIDELDPFVRDCTTTAIGVDNNNQYYLSSSSYPVCQKLKIWARSHRITVVEDAGHAEAVLVNKVSKIKHIEPSRDVCLECEHKMLKHHVTTSRPFSHKLSKGQRTGKSYTEEERQFAKTMKAESSTKANNVAKARRLLVEGDLSLTDIGRQTGINKSTMVSWPEHKIWVEKQKKRKAGDPRKAKALAMSLEGISQNEIANKLKTSKTKISQWIKESKQKNTDYAIPTTSGKRAALRQGLSHTTRAHMQSSLRSEIRVASEGLNQQGLLRWLQEPGMSQHSYHDILDVLEEEEIDFNINDFISAWNATGRPLPE